VYGKDSWDKVYAHIGHGAQLRKGPRADQKSGRKAIFGNIKMNDEDSIAHIPAAPAHRDTPAEPGILVLCTANVCRSAMAAPLLARRLAALGVTTPVRSAGMIRDGDPPLPEVISVMASYGIETAAHRSRVACAADLALATLVLAMSRENLRYAVASAPGAWPRAFTLRELIRRGEQIGPRPPGEPFSGWLSRAHAGRERVALLGDSAEDDVADPAGGPRRAYADTARLLERLVTRLAELGWAHTRPGP
jgi:protein-tyrosine phosphatase